MVLPPGRSLLTTIRDAPSVTGVYIPASHQAGSLPARAEFLVAHGPVSTTTGLVGATVTGNVEARTEFDVVFADSALVLEYRGDGALDSTVVTLYRSARTAVAPTGAATFTPYREQRFRSRLPVLLSLSSAGQATTQVAGGLTTTRIRALSGLLVDRSDGTPIFLSTTMSGTAFTPPALFSHARGGRFVFSANNLPGSKRSENWALDGEVLRSVSWPTLRWADGGSPTGAQYGFYDVRWQGPAFAGSVAIDLQDTDRVRQQYAGILSGRTVASRTVTDPATAALVAAALNLPPEQVRLADVALPFAIVNRAFGGEQGRAVRVAILESSLPEQVLLGTGVDTATVAVPASTWIPSVPMVLIEDVELASTNAQGEVVTGADGRPTLRTEPRVTWRSARLSCLAPSIATCNPVRGRGQSGFVDARPGMALEVHYAGGFSAESEYRFALEPAVVGRDIAALGPNGLADVRVVPNPYIVMSTYEQERDSRRIMFTNLPPEGRIRIFTAAGRFVQEITWVPEQLDGNGDLFYNLRTREDTELVGGLYLYVVEALGTAGNGSRKIGKFIIIR
jgi:hypothetical protein